jgi:excisionase family DNA binding protein
MAFDIGQLVSVPELAELSDVEPHYVRADIRERRLSAIVIGRREYRCFAPAARQYVAQKRGRFPFPQKDWREVFPVGLDDYFGTQTIARLLNTSDQFVRNLARVGELRAYRVGRDFTVRGEMLLKFLLAKRCTACGRHMTECDCWAPRER